MKGICGFLKNRMWREKDRVGRSHPVRGGSGETVG